MYHEATACHVTGDLVELLSIFLSVLKATRPYLQRKGTTLLTMHHTVQLELYDYPLCTLTPEFLLLNALQKHSVTHNAPYAIQSYSFTHNIPARAV